MLTSRLPLIRRTALLASLAGTEAPVIWIAAAPGAGKTTLLAQHLETVAARGEPALQVSLDGPEPERVLSDTLERLSQHPQRLTLCLDDCHLAVGEAGTRQLGALLRRASPTLRIIATSQGEPSVPLADLELKGVVHRYGTAELRFTQTEMREFLGADLCCEAADALASRTAGWPIALLLARAQLVKHGSAFTPELVSGTDATLARYFTERVLDATPEPSRRFLLETAILEHLNGDVADAVRDSTDSWMLIEDLQRRALFIEPVDPDGEWFQYQPLFREFLLSRLRRADAPRERALRRRAADWFARHAEWPEAIRQALSSGDVDLASGIVDRTNYLELYLRFGRSVLGELDQLPDDRLARYPRLALCVAYAHFQEGRFPHARRLLDAQPSPAIRGEAHEDTTGNMQRQIFAALLDMCEDHPNRERLEGIEARLVRGEVEDPLTRGECYIVLMVARQDQDDPAAALALSDRLLHETQHSDLPYLDGFTWLLRGMVHMARAELGAAEQCYERCLEVSQRKFGRSAPHTSIVEILLAETLYERDRAAEAAAPLERGLQRIDNVYGWHELWEPAILTAAPLFARLQGPDRALDFLQQSQSLAQTRGLDRAAMLCEIARVGVLTRSGQLGEAIEALEGASFRSLLDRPLEMRTSRILTPALLAAHDLALASDEPDRWVGRLNSHIAYLRERGLRRRLLGMLLGQAAGAERVRQYDVACASFREALLLGAARGYVRLFLERAEQLQGTIARIAAERFDPGSDAELRTMLASMRERANVVKSTPGLLSPREVQVLSLMPEGLTSKQIAQRLGLTENTVKGYRRSLFEKLGVTSRAQAIEKGRALRLLL